MPSVPGSALAWKSASAGDASPSSTASAVNRSGIAFPRGDYSFGPSPRGVPHTAMMVAMSFSRSIS